jgi:hypothetical protein
LYDTLGFIWLGVIGIFLVNATKVEVNLPDDYSYRRNRYEN